MQAMPRPQKLTEEQEWFLSLLDLKFQQHEHRIWRMMSETNHWNGAGFETVEHEESNLGRVLDELELINADPIQNDEKEQETAEEPPENSKDTRNLRPARLGSVYVMSEVSEPEPHLKTFVKGPLDLLMGLVVVANLSVMAAVTQTDGYVADIHLGLATGSPWGLTNAEYEVAELVFFFIYISDVLARICILRSQWYYDLREGWMYMNFFDALLVTVQAFEIALLPVSES